MATVIDALTVTLGLDPKDFIRGTKTAHGATIQFGAATREAYEQMEKEVTKELKQIGKEQAKAAKEAEKQAKAMAKAHDEATESVNRLARNALRLFAVFTAGKAVGEFVSQITSADAALGRLASRIGQAPGDISALASAVGRAGGSMEATQGSMERFSDAMQELKRTGTTGILTDLSRIQALGGKPIDLFNKDTLQTQYEIADNLKAIKERYGEVEARSYGKQAGFDADTITLMIQGSAAMKRAAEESRKLGVATEKDTKAAQAFQTSIRGLTQVSEGLGRTLWTNLSPALTDVVNRVLDWYKANGEWLRTQIAEKVKALADYIRSIDWDRVGKGILTFARGADDAAKSIGGWKVAAEAFFGLWAASKIVGLFAPLFGQLALVRLTLLRMGPIGWGLLGLGALAGALASADPSKAIVSGGVPSGGLNPGDELPGLGGGGGSNRGGVFARARRGAAERTRKARGGAVDKTDYNFTGENADALRQAAKELGTSPEDLATVISYESKFRPDIHGGKGGNYQGLIQFGKPEREQFGANDKQTFKEQLPAVVRYLKTRGFQPGMGLNQLYATINGGNPTVSQNASDGNGTIAQHVERMRKSEADRVNRFLGSTGGTSEVSKPNAAPGASTTSNPDGSPLPTDGKGVNDDLMKVVKRAQELSGVKFHIHEGLRTLDRQKEMVQRGWSKTMNSKHLTGRAVDLRADGDPAVGDLDTAKYAKINEAMKKASEELKVPVQWGGDSFGKFKDVPHFQLPDGYKGAAQPSAMRGIPNAASVASQTQAAQATMASAVSNDNRSSVSNSTKIGDVHVHTAATEPDSIARDMEGALKRRSFAVAANYGQA